MTVPFYISVKFWPNILLKFFHRNVEKSEPRPPGGSEAQHPSPEDPGGEDEETNAKGRILATPWRRRALEDGDEVQRSLTHIWRFLQQISEMCQAFCCLVFCRRYEEDMYWRRMEEEQHHWDERRRMPDGGYPQGPPGPPGLLGVRPGMPIPQPQGPVVSLHQLEVLLVYLLMSLVLLHL